MELIHFAVILSALFCSLVAGLVFTFAIVVMPGIRALGDLDFLRAFQAMDRVIQQNQPVFMLVWLGSVLVLLASTVLGFWRLEGLDRILLVVACTTYIAGLGFLLCMLNFFPAGERPAGMHLLQVRAFRARRAAMFRPSTKAEKAIAA